MVRKVLPIVVFLCLTTLLAAQQFTVDYVDGYLDVDDRGSWYELYIGDPVSASDTVRLGDNSYAELSDGSITIKLTRPGVYRMSELTVSARRTESSGVGGLILNRVGRLTGQQDEQDQAFAGGVRASEAVNQNQPTWAGGESVDELIEEGLGLLGTGELEEAYWVFQEAYDYALDDDEFAKSAFYFGYGAALIGKTTEAFDLLEDVGPDPDTEFFADHVLVLGELLVQTFAYEDALGYLSLLTDSEESQPEDLQSAYLLAGLAYDGLGDVRMARSSLRQSRDVLPDSEGADIAAELLEQL
jgi:tetratricopeptide (TPR) repeat protein